MRTHREMLPLIFTTLLAACALPINTGLGGGKDAVAPSTKAWKSSTVAAADAVRKGELDEAEKHLERARRAAVTEPEDDEYAASLMNLGHVHSAKGDTANAVVFYEKALASREQHLGANHLEVANTLNTLGASYAFLQRNDDAEKAFQRALEIRHEKLGDKNLLTGQSMNNLALLFAGKGDYDSAEPLYVQSIEIIQTAPNSSRADLIRALDNYAAMLSDDGREAEAEAIRTRAGAERKEYDRFRDDLNATDKK